MKRLLFNMIVSIGFGNVFASESSTSSELVSNDTATATVEVTENPKPIEIEKMSANLKSNNPFVPFKTSERGVDSLTSVEASNFEFFSVVKYSDHLEFGLKEKTLGQEFWLSSEPSKNDGKFGITYWNFSPIDRVLIVQDAINGNLVRITQVEPNLESNKNSSLGYNSASNWASMLDDLDDEDMPDDWDNRK